MGYIQKNLMPGEEVLLRPRYHPVRFLPGAVGAVLGLLVALSGLVVPAGTAEPGVLLAVGGVLAAAGLGAMGMRALVDSFDEFAVTTLRIIKKTGILTRRVSQIPLDKVQDLRLAATLWGRWLSYGDVEVESAGEDGPVVFARIQNPEDFRNVFFARQATRAPGAAAAGPAAGARSVEERLAELDRLRQRGLITEEEHRTRRQELIREI